MKKLILICLISVMVTLAGAVQAQEFGFKGIGGKIGLVDPESLSGTVGFGAHVDLGYLGKVIKFVPAVEYWSKDNLSQFSIQADGRYYYSDSNVDPYIGAGIGLFFSSFDSDIDLVGSASSTDIGLDLFGGIDIPIGKQWVFTGEVKYVWTELSSFRLTGGVMYYLK